MTISNFSFTFSQTSSDLASTQATAAQQGVPQHAVANLDWNALIASLSSSDQLQRFPSSNSEAFTAKDHQRPQQQLPQGPKKSLQDQDPIPIPSFIPPDPTYSGLTEIQSFLGHSSDKVGPDQATHGCSISDLPSSVRPLGSDSNLVPGFNFQGHHRSPFEAFLSETASPASARDFNTSPCLFDEYDFDFDESANTSHLPLFPEISEEQQRQELTNLAQAFSSSSSSTAVEDWTSRFTNPGAGSEPVRSDIEQRLEEMGIASSREVASDALPVVKPFAGTGESSIFDSFYFDHDVVSSKSSQTFFLPPSSSTVETATVASTSHPHEQAPAMSSDLAQQGATDVEKLVRSLEAVGVQLTGEAIAKLVIRTDLSVQNSPLMASLPISNKSKSGVVGTLRPEEPQGSISPAFLQTMKRSFDEVDEHIKFPLLPSEQHQEGEKVDEVACQPVQKRTKRSLVPPHEKGKRFHCEVCNKPFERHFNLKTHMLTHEDPENRQKNFICPLESCSKAFARKHDRDRHHKTVHLKTPKVVGKPRGSKMKAASGNDLG